MLEQVHSHLAEALERLLLERFLTTLDETPKPPAEMPRFVEVKECFTTLTNDPVVQELYSKYLQFKKGVRDGIHGKTIQFLLVYYLDIMRIQHLIHYTVQKKNFSLRLYGLKKVLLFMFVSNKQNYARSGSIFVNSLENLEQTHPGCLKLIQDKGISVQTKDEYPCRTAIGQRGEQTINRDGKVYREIKFFASDSTDIISGH